MSGFDQTGPSRQGPMTGYRRGRCMNFGSDLNKANTATAENQEEKQPENFPGRGFGKGRGWRSGRGMGRQNRFRGGF